MSQLDQQYVVSRLERVGRYGPAMPAGASQACILYLECARIADSMKALGVNH